MGSDSKSSGESGGGGTLIPGGANTMVQSLREIVNKKCTDSEIYAVLKECGMDPNDAAQRLLSQDTFHEVKSKRERRKEMKETQEPRVRGNYGASIRGGRIGSEHTVVSSASTNSSSNELGIAAYWKEDGTVTSLPYSSSISHTSGKTLNQRPSPHRELVPTGDIVSSSVQPSPGLQPSWTAATPGHVSMADIVRMGRPQNKGSQMSIEVPHVPQDTVLLSSQSCSKPSHSTGPARQQMNQELHSPQQFSVSEVTTGQHDFENEWPVIEQITTTTSSALDVSAASDAKYHSKLHIFGDSVNSSRRCQSDEIQVLGMDFASENLNSDYIGPASMSSGHIMVNGTGAVPADNWNFLNEKNSCDSHARSSEHQEGDSAPFSDDIEVALSSATVRLQQVSLGKDEPVVPPAEDKPAVVLPNHLQALAADCAHLSFGTYRSGNNSAFSGLIASNSLRKDLQEVSAGTNGSSAVHLDTRNFAYDGGKKHGFMYDIHRKAADSRDHDLPVHGRAELMNPYTPEEARVQERILSSSLCDSGYRNVKQLDSPITLAMNPKAVNLPPKTSELRSYSNTIPIDLLASMQARDSASFMETQPMPLRYGSTLSSINNPTLSMTEPSSQTLLGCDLATGPALPQHLSANPYSESGYPVMHQSYNSMPSSRPAALESDWLHQSLAGLNYNLLQNRSSGTINSLTLSNSNTSAYGSLGSSTNIPGSFQRNLTTSHAGIQVGYEDVLRSQYRDGNNYALNQNYSSSTWNYGPGSRTISNVPDSANYSLLGQNQLHAGYRQRQQPFHYGARQYQNNYNGELGITREQHQRSPGDLSLNDCQMPSSKQSHQLWQPGY